MEKRKRISKRKRVGRNWSDLPLDILLSISSRLSFLDTLCFSRVCCWWRVAIKQFSNRKSFPLLLFFSHTDQIPNEDEIQAEKLYRRQSIQQRCKINRNRPIGRLRFKSPPPPTPTPPIPKRQSLGHDYKVSLYSINDEKEYTPPNLYYSSPSRQDLVGSDPDGSLHIFPVWYPPLILKLIPDFYQFTLGMEYRFEIRKSIFYPTAAAAAHGDDLVVIAIIKHPDSKGTKLAFSRPRVNNRWELLAGEYYSDIAFSYTTRTLYSLKIVRRFESVSVEAWDFSAMDQCLPQKKFTCQVSCLTGCMSRGDYYCHTTRLVLHPITGQLLVLAYVGTHKDDINLKWLILNVDFDQLRCQQLDSFNGEALLLSFTSSIFVSSNDVQLHRYRPDSIYFSNWWAGLSANQLKLSNYSIQDAQVQHVWGSINSNLAIGSSWIVLSI